MIYVISEDTYFSIGIGALLKNAEIEVHCISLDTFFNINTDIESNDIVLLCAQSRANSMVLAKLARNTEGKVVFFIETIEKNNIFHDYSRGIISKKTSKEDLVTLIQSLNDKFVISPMLLSEMETVVMDMFVQQHTAYNIARLLKLSEKTISTHKTNALRKLGLSNLNVRSVLLYERIFQAQV